MRKFILSTTLILILLCSLSSLVLAETNPYVTYQELDEGMNYIHAFIFAKENYIYASTRTYPAIILRFNKTNISEYISLEYPADNSHDFAEQLVYVESNDKLYTAHKRNYVAATGTISEIDPYNLSGTDVVVQTGLGNNAWFNTPGFTTDGKFLYLFQNYMFHYNLTTFARDQWYDTGTTNGHSLEYNEDDGLLYGTTAGGYATRTNPVTRLTNVSLRLASLFSDDICVKGNYLYAVDEGTYNGFPTGTVHIIYKNNLTEKTTIDPGFNASGYGVSCDDNYLWVSYNTRPGTVLRINLTSFEYESHTFDVGYNSVNEVISDNENVYLTFWNMSPAVVAKFNLSDWDEMIAWTPLESEPTRDELIQQQIEEEAHNNNAIIFGAFTLIALAILVGAGVLIYKAMEGGFDAMSFTLLAISAIGLTIVIFLGYYILSVMASSIS